MIWEARTKSVGEWTETEIAVARDANDNFSWTGRLMMRTDEWRDFTVRFGMREVSQSLWRCGS